jgi:putative DNA methylase
MNDSETKLNSCFIETQFPVSKLSKESYGERKSPSQILTGLGKWWGRKPLVLCRAIILGLILPSTNDYVKDRDIFLRLMTMDDDGLLRRKSKNISPTDIFKRLPPTERARYFEMDSTDQKAILKKGLASGDKAHLQKSVFLSMSYDEKLDYCDRFEQIDGPSPESWRKINEHLGTNASCVFQLMSELGSKKYGHLPRVGDSFCGGGSIPFEAARLGCDAYGSDLNPVAVLLTWAALNITGGGKQVVDMVQKAQFQVYQDVDSQITKFGIEHREPDVKTCRVWRADAYLYCVEITCPECDWRVPLAPSWVVATKNNVVAKLIPDTQRKCFTFDIKENASEDELILAQKGTVENSDLVCPNCLKTQREKARTPIKVIRGDGRGTFGDNKSFLREWGNRDLVPIEGDIFGERLYCIRWIDIWKDKDGKEHSDRYYRSPTFEDMKREQKVLDLIMERFDNWQATGIIPRRKIEAGYNTTQPIREKGWTFWHHLFTPRQLLLIGTFAVESRKYGFEQSVILQLLIGRLADWNSRLSVWLPSHGGGIGSGKNTFLNQALNTLFNYSVRPYATTYSLAIPSRIEICKRSDIRVCDARNIDIDCDIWITDPPYADAINYEEISEYFLAWHERQILNLFPTWYADSRRALAIKGNQENFRKVMIDCYHVLAEHMPDNGLQVVMFTHQDAGVWADLTLILWAAGLRVTAAWCIATETTSLKSGNYVQGTVLLVLRKQKLTETAFLDEIYPQVETEVRNQLDSMFNLDDMNDPNFSDTDYQLAAYAAALRILTSKKIEEIDVSYEITRTRVRGEISPVEKVIRNAVAIACDHLVPLGMERYLWKSLSALERFYIKGLEMESHGEGRIGVYQELARGFGIPEYVSLLADTRANQVRLKTASEFSRRELSGEGFSGTLLRQVLFGIYKTSETESPLEAITWFTNEIHDYSGNRARIIEILEFISNLRKNSSMVHWHKDADAAAILAGALRNRQDNV